MFTLKMKKKKQNTKYDTLTQTHLQIAPNIYNPYCMSGRCFEIDRK